MMPAEITENTVRERIAARNARSVVISVKTETATTAIAMIKTTITAIMINTATTVNKKVVS